MAKTFRYDDVPVLQTTSGKLKGYFYDGEYIFKNVCPGRTKKYEREIRIAMGHLQTVQYIAAITV